MNELCKECRNVMLEKGGKCFYEGLHGFRQANVADSCIFRKPKENSEKS